MKRCLHCHPRNNHTRLTLDDALDDILNVIAACGCSLIAGLVGAISTTPSQDFGIFAEGVHLVLWADGKDSRQRELQLFDSHGL